MRGLVHVQRYRHALILRDQGLSYAAMATAIGLGHPLKAWRLHKTALKWLEEITGRLETPAPRPAPDPAVVAWAAGFFDGEGCIHGSEGIQGGRWRRFTFSVSASQAVRDPLDLLQQTWGGAVRFQKRTQPHHRDQWAWAIRGQDAAQFLSDVLPYLRVKDEAARAAIPCLFRTHRHGEAFTEEDVIGRRAAIAVLRSLNRRGKAVA